MQPGPQGSRGSGSVAHPTFPLACPMRQKGSCIEPHTPPAMYADPSVQRAWNLAYHAQLADNNGAHWSAHIAMMSLMLAMVCLLLNDGTRSPKHHLRIRWAALLMSNQHVSYTNAKSALYAQT